MQTSQDRLVKLHEDSNNAIQRVQHIFNTSKQFSNSFDSYLNKISEMVRNLLDTSEEEEQMLVQHYHSEKGKGLHSQAITKNQTQTGQLDPIYEYGVLTAPKQKNIFNSLPADYIQQTNRTSMGISEEMKPPLSSMQQRGKQQVFGNIKLQNEAFRRLLDSGEFNAQNLKKIMNEVFNTKTEGEDVQPLKDKIASLKKKLAKTRDELEAKEKENQDLKINLSVSQNVKKELEHIQSNIRRDVNNSFNSQSTQRKNCRNCERVQIKLYKARHENDSMAKQNALLVGQLEYSQSKLDILNRNMEMMSNEFFELYKTIHGKLANQSSQVSYNVPSFYQDESQQKMSEYDSPLALNSNYNTQSDKFNNLKNFLAQQEGDDPAPIERQSSYNNQYTSPHHRQDDRQMLDLKYSTVTENVGLKATCQSHNDFSACDCISQKRPCTDYKKHRDDDIDKIDTPDSKNHSSVPLEFLLEKNKAIVNKLREMNTIDVDKLRVEEEELLRRSSSLGEERKIKIDMDGLGDRDYSNSPAFKQHNTPKLTVVKSSQNEKNEFKDNDSDERMSLVEMSVSIENSLEDGEHMLDPTRVKQGENLIRISFANKDNFIKDALEKRDQESEEDLRGSQDIGEIKQGQIYDNNGESPDLLHLKQKEGGFVTFSKKGDSDYEFEY